MTQRNKMIFQNGVKSIKAAACNGAHTVVTRLYELSKTFQIGTIQVLRQQRGGWVGSEIGYYC